MANAIYPKYKEALLQGGTNISLSSGTVKVTLVDLADYTYSSAHQFYSDITVAGRVAVATLANKTQTNGVFDADDAVFSTVTGDQSEALVIWIDTGVESTSRLVAFLDTGITGMPVTPSGGNITVTWDNGSNKIFAL